MKRACFNASWNFQSGTVHNFGSIVVMIQARQEHARACWVKKMELGLESEKALDGASSQRIASREQRCHGPWVGGRMGPLEMVAMSQGFREQKVVVI